MTTLRQLIDALEETALAYGDDAEVRLMTQAEYPFENELFGITTGAEINGRVDDDEQDVDDDHAVYLVEGSQLRYGSKRAWVVAQPF